MKNDLDEILETLTDRQRLVVLAFQAPHDYATALAERTGLSVAEVEATREELIEKGLVGCSI